MEKMKFYDKAKRLLSGDTFDRKRYLAARALYHRAKGQEKELIGRMFESQMVLIRGEKDLEWVRRIDDNLSRGNFS